MLKKKVVSIRDASQVKDEAWYNAILFWAGKEKLFTAIDELGKNFNGKKVSFINICSDISYENRVIFKTPLKRAKAFSALSEVVGAKPELTKKDKLVLNDDDGILFFKTVQQLLNLGMVADVVAKNESEKEKLTSNMLSKDYKIRAKIRQLNEYILYLKEKMIDEQFDDSLFFLDRLVNRTNNVEKLLDRIGSDNILRIAIFGTKNAGKSMLVNALLGDEYVPTSMETYFPNVIRYVPSKNKQIRVEYKDKVYQFQSIGEMKEYIITKLKYSSMSNGSSNENLTIYYPSEQQKNSDTAFPSFLSRLFSIFLRKNNMDEIKYEIWDTPGSDMGGYDSFEAINRAIEQADVGIFVMDYSKYMQQSEIELLKVVKKKFDESETAKLFMIALNKIDLMLSDVSTVYSIPRLTDFIVNKLNLLGHDNVVVIPISALIFFYLQKLGEEYPNLRKTSNFYADLTKIFYAPEFEHMDRETQVYIQTLISYINSLRKLFDREKILNFEDVEKGTNFKVFKGYLLYILEKKAILEKRYSIALKIIEELLNLMKEIKKESTDLIQETFAIKKDMKEIESLLNDLHNKHEEFDSNVASGQLLRNYVESEIARLREYYLKMAAKLFEDFKIRETAEKLREFRAGLDESLKGQSAGTSKKLTLNIDRLHDELEKLLSTFYTEVETRDFYQKVKSFESDAADLLERLLEKSPEIKKIGQNSNLDSFESQSLTQKLVTIDEMIVDYSPFVKLKTIYMENKGCLSSLLLFIPNSIAYLLMKNNMVRKKENEIIQEVEQIILKKQRIFNSYLEELCMNLLENIESRKATLSQFYSTSEQNLRKLLREKNNDFAQKNCRMNLWNQIERKIKELGLERDLRTVLPNAESKKNLGISMN